MCSTCVLYFLNYVYNVCCVLYARWSAKKISAGRAFKVSKELSEKELVEAVAESSKSAAVGVAKVRAEKAFNSFLLLLLLLLLLIVMLLVLALVLPSSFVFLVVYSCFSRPWYQ